MIGVAINTIIFGVISKSSALFCMALLSVGKLVYTLLSISALLEVALGLCQGYGCNYAAYRPLGFMHTIFVSNGEHLASTGPLYGDPF